MIPRKVDNVVTEHAYVVVKIATWTDILGWRTDKHYSSSTRADQSGEEEFVDLAEVSEAYAIIIMAATEHWFQATYMYSLSVDGKTRTRSTWLLTFKGGQT